MSPTSQILSSSAPQSCNTSDPEICSPSAPQPLSPSALSSLTAWVLVILLTLEPAGGQLGNNIRIDWIMDKADGTKAYPRLMGLDGTPVPKGQMTKETPQPAVKTKEPGIDAARQKYERAWRDGGFAKTTKESWFAASRKVRATRPATITHPVGTVYKHTKTGARGVVVGWDDKTVAPKRWVDATDNYGGYDWQDRLARLYEPHYSVLEEVLGENGEMQYMQRYVVSLCRTRQSPPSCLQIEDPAGELSHPDLDLYFQGFDPKKGYLPNDHLSSIYPEG